MSQSGWTDKRPMSPHLWNWRWHITMWGSILNRAAGIANYLGATIVVLWLFAAASGPETYEMFEGVAASIPCQIILFGFTASILYHALNGVRHLIWDVGHGFTPKVASFTAWLALILAAAGAVGIWFAAGLIPGVSL